MHHSYKLSDLPGEHKGLQVKAYVWNKGLESFEISWFQIDLREGTPISMACTNHFPEKTRFPDQTSPWSIIASATFTNPAMLAPFT